MALRMQFEPISVQNTRLRGELDDGSCEAYAGTETASSNLEILF